MGWIHVPSPSDPIIIFFYIDILLNIKRTHDKNKKTNHKERDESSPPHGFMLLGCSAYSDSMCILLLDVRLSFCWGKRGIAFQFFRKKTILDILLGREICTDSDSSTTGPVMFPSCLETLILTSSLARYTKFCNFSPISNVRSVKPYGRELDHKRISVTPNIP